MSHQDGDASVRDDDFETNRLRTTPYSHSPYLQISTAGSQLLGRRNMNTFRVLVVEDDEQVRSFLNERLKREGYEVRTADSGNAGLSLLETSIFDAALIDIHLPDMLGIELLEAAKKRDSGIDVVVMTGYPEV